MKKSDNTTKGGDKNLYGSRFFFKFLISGTLLSFAGWIFVNSRSNILVNSRDNKHNLINAQDPYRFLNLDPIMPPDGEILKSLAIPRVSGSKENVQVREFIKSQFDSRYWDIEEDAHTMDSPHGQSTTFVNLIITLIPHSGDNKRVILAAHYDSKLLEAEGSQEGIATLESSFVGASDSAWSCALMISLARAIETELNDERSELRDLKTNTKIKQQHGFQLVFFDGEEAVKNWSPSDSLYGSRALAAKWSKLPAASPNALGKIELMVLLDLLGTRDGGQFYTFHPAGSLPDQHFRELVRIERQHYDNNNILFSESRELEGYQGTAVEDDHTPFLPFGVPVLHLIPLPFPSVWHTHQDTIEALDRQVCERTSKIIFNFIRNKLYGY